MVSVTEGISHKKELFVRKNFLCVQHSENGCDEKHEALNTRKVPDTKYPRCTDEQGKFHPRTSHENPEGEKRNSSTLSLTSSLDGGGWTKPLHARKRLGTHCIEGWEGPRAGLDGF